MRLLRSPVLKATFIYVMSAFYSIIFIFTANHMELNGMLADGTLQSGFWNGWSDFIKAGYMVYIGYTIIGLTIIIFFLMLYKRTQKYDEYQTSVLAKILIFTGTVSIIMMPMVMFMLINDRNYTIETIFLFATVQWIGVLLLDLFYVIKY